MSRLPNNTVDQESNIDALLRAEIKARWQAMVRATYTFKGQRLCAVTVWEEATFVDVCNQRLTVMEEEK